MKMLIKRCAAILGLSLLLATGIQAASSVTFYHHDALGSIIATSDQDGLMSLNEEYQPYGEKIYGTEDPVSDNEDWYTGKNYSKELDLTYFGARWYDAKQGRFLSMDPAPVSLASIHSFNRYHYANNNPYKYVDPDGNSATPNDIYFFAKDVGNLLVQEIVFAAAVIKGDTAVANLAIQGMSNAVGDAALGAAGLVNPIPGTSSLAKAAKSGSTETVQRWMSKAELGATQKTGLLRGGRDGTHYVTDAANSSALRARQRLSLPQTSEVRVTLDVPKGVFSKPSKVDPAFNMSGGGMERTASGNIPVNIRRVQ